MWNLHRLAALVVAALSASAFAAPADTIYLGGEVYVGSDKEPDKRPGKRWQATAIAVKGGRIVAVGDDASVLAHRGPGTSVVDLRGRTVFPGLQAVEVTRVTKTLMSSQPYALLVKMSFADDESFRAAMKSPENALTGADLANFADGLATILFGEIIFN